MILQAPSLDALSYVASNMREWDRREIYATRWSDDPLTLARDSLDVGGLSWVAGLEFPICAFGAFPMFPGCWAVWLYATDDFDKIGIPLTRHVRKAIIPSLISAGVRRVECRSMEGHTFAHRWMESGLKMTREASLDRYGKGGETFHIYRRIF